MKFQVVVYMVLAIFSLTTYCFVCFQFFYGEDGLDVNKTGFLVKKQLPFLAENKAVMVKHKQVNREDNEADCSRLQKKVSLLFVQ